MKPHVILFLLKQKYFNILIKNHKFFVIKHYKIMTFLRFDKCII